MRVSNWIQRRSPLWRTSFLWLFGTGVASALTGFSTPSRPPPVFEGSSLDPLGQAWVEQTLAELSLPEAVGQLIFPWISGGYTAEDDPETQETYGWVESEGIGGVVISIGSPLAYAAKLNALQRRARIPLLVTSDFENGGPGMRIAHAYALPSLLSQGGGTSFPPTMAFGAVGDLELIERFGEVTAREARAVGVHVVFAPVVDVNSNPDNPIINTRAFGEDPTEVGARAVAFHRGARRGGVLTTAKHFPGHGDTRVDSHLTLPEVEADRARLDAVELPPFRAAVEGGVDGIMTAHVALPRVLGPDAPPATLAPEFMTGILRGEMGFQGLLFTDALRMGAITERYGAGEAAVLAFEAGADVLVIPASVPGALAAMVEAVESGRISRDRLDQSVRRILEAKARLGLNEGALVSLEDVSRVVGRRIHLELADEAAERSLTLVRDQGGLVPAHPDRVRQILSITWAAPEDLIAGREFESVFAALRPGVSRPVRIGPQTSSELFAELARAAGEVDLTLVHVYLPPRAGAGSVALPDAFRAFLADLARDASGNARPLVLTSFGNPYLLTAVPEVGSYLLAWGDREVSQRAAARALAGARSVGGRLPISIPPLHARGEGLDRAALPAIAEREEQRGDALDESGLLRHAPASGGEGGADSPGREVPADTVGMDAEALARLDALILQAIADSVSPGVALAVGRGDRLVRLRGYGTTDWAPGSPEVTPETLYDLASLTKVVGTTTAIMALVEAGLLHLDERVVEVLPDFAAGDARKARVTLRDLLLHRAGLPPFRAFFREFETEAEVRDAIWAMRLARDPGGETVYSDIGFKVLAWVVEARSGVPLDVFLRDRVFAPLGMGDTQFNPRDVPLPRIAPTEVDRERRMRHVHGEVHDENAGLLGGVAGHAGLFSTARDLAIFAALFAAEGAVDPCSLAPSTAATCGPGGSAPIRVLQPETVREFARPGGAGSSRALGWDTPSGQNSSAGAFFSARAFGHTGFTGTSLWIDPELGVWVVLLTNRVNPTRENQRHLAFRRGLHDAVAEAIVDRSIQPRERGFE